MPIGARGAGAVAAARLPSILILTDRPESLPAYLSELTEFPCRIEDILTLDEKKGRATENLIIGYADLRKAETVIKFRSALNHRRSGATPLLCLLGDYTHRAKAQAYSLGATRTHPISITRQMLLANIAEMLPGFAPTPAPSVACADGETRVATSVLAKQALGALTDISDACIAGEPIALEAISAGTEAILHATERADIRGWLDVVKRYDDRTHQHCLMVAGLVASFVTLLGFRMADRRRLTRAALLHDIGKARIPIEILNKPGRLNETEMAQMRLHAPIGYDLLVGQGGFDAELLSVVRHHHEYLDGSGYPDGLTAYQISDAVRIITICDIYAALIEARPYKTPLDPQQSYDILVGMGGKLDRDLLMAFDKVVRACAADSKVA